MIAEHNVVVKNRMGRDIHCTVTPSGSMVLTDVVILVHGFKGFRNWGFFPIAAQYFGDKGFHVIRIDLSMNGMDGTNDRVQNLDDFAANTISTEVNDVLDVVSELTDGNAFASIQQRLSGDLHFIGHSRGGAVVQIAAAEMLNNGIRVRSVIGWNSIGKLGRFTERQQQEWRQAGYVEFENSRTGQMLRMNSSYLDDTLQLEENNTLVDSAKRLGKKLHFVHAETDLTVNIAEVRRLITATGASIGLTEIEGSTHTFGMTHPIDHLSGSFLSALKYTNRHIQG